MSGRTGFGLAQIDPRVASPKLSELQALAAAGDTTALLQLIEQHLDRVEKRYVEDPLAAPNQVNIPGSAVAFTNRLDFSTTPHNSLIVSVTAGTLNLMLGDYSGLNQASQPHLQFAAGTVTQLFFPLQGRVYIVINPSSTIALTACVTPVAL